MGALSNALLCALDTVAPSAVGGRQEAALAALHVGKKWRSSCG